MSAVNAIESAGQATCNGSEHADPRVRRTRKLLHDAFRTLIHERKFSDISVQNVTELAGVNRATFYAHYDDKESLGISVVRTDLQAAVKTVFAQKPAFTAENLVIFGVAVIEFVDSIHNVCRKKTHSPVSASKSTAASDLHGALSIGIVDEIYDIVYGWLGNSKAHLRIFPVGSRDAIATIIASSIYGAAFRWVRLNRRERSAEEVSRGIVDVLTRS